MNQYLTSKNNKKKYLYVLSYWIFTNEGYTENNVAPHFFYSSNTGPFPVVLLCFLYLL